MIIPKCKWRCFCTIKARNEIIYSGFYLDRKIHILFRKVRNQKNLISPPIYQYHFILAESLNLYIALKWKNVSRTIFYLFTINNWFILVSTKYCNLWKPPIQSFVIKILSGWRISINTTNPANIRFATFAMIFCHWFSLFGTRHSHNPVNLPIYN